MKTRTMIILTIIVTFWFQAIALSNAGHGSAFGSASYLYARGLPTMAEWAAFFLSFVA